MVLMSKTYGFKTLGPFYITTQIFGLSMVREIDNKICCSKKSKFVFHYTYCNFNYVIIFVCIQNLSSQKCKNVIIKMKKLIV